MAASPAPADRPLMDEGTFYENFGMNMPKKTFLCYEWDVPESDSRIPADKLKGFLRNKGADTAGQPRHAELCFLDLISSWGLDREQHYNVTLFISWSPCSDCARSLVKFLGENSHVGLRIFAARIYTKGGGCESGLQQLQEAGARLAIMFLPEYQHCWETFVDHGGQPFQPQENLQGHIQEQSRRLEDILQIQGK